MQIFRNVMLQCFAGNKIVFFILGYFLSKLLRLLGAHLNFMKGGSACKNDYQHGGMTADAC